MSRRSGRVITRLGNPSLQPGSRRALSLARQARTDRADAHAADVLAYIEAARAAGCSSLGELARALTARGIETPAGGRGWSPVQVRRVLDVSTKNYALAPTRPRIEAALSTEPSAAECPQGCGLVFAPGWWCEECEGCAFPTLLLDSDYEDDPLEPNGDDEPDDDYA